MSTGIQTHSGQTDGSVRPSGILTCGISALPDNSEVVDLQRATRIAIPPGSLNRLPAVFFAGAATMLVAAGSISLLPLWLNLIHLWATDSLRSIGAALPIVACVGVLAAWRRLSWRMDGTFWALLPVALSILLARAIADSAVVISYDGQSLMIRGIVLLLYGVGAVLLFGGPRLLRASIAPLCLLLFVNPVPEAFNLLVDMPLQNLSASTARSFAHLMDLQPTGVQLRMMFAPDFGMFIAPGCNGVRGSITLGYLALIFGYARHLRPRSLILVSLSAFLLGYALNLLRLCVLVVYYRVGVSFPALQGVGTEVDYMIGCTLFLFAAAGLGLLIRSLEPACASGTEQAALAAAIKESESRQSSWPFVYAAVARSICFFALAMAVIIPDLRSSIPRLATRPDEQQVLSSFPPVVGSYKLTRTWAEHNASGMIALAMAEYSTSPDRADSARVLTFGLWVGSAEHLVSDSKFIQGLQAQWTGGFDATAQQALPVHFVTSFYDDGISRQYDAESTCSSTDCSVHLARPGHDGFVFLTPRTSNLTFAFSGRRLPVLLRREWLDSDPTPSADLRAQFETDARLFVEQIDLRRLLGEDGSQL